MTYLLDTNVISEVRKGTSCNASVAAWFASVDADELFISALVLGEIRKGIEKLRAREAERAESLDRWLTALETDYRDRIVGVDAAVADAWGRMSARRPTPVIDSLLAATAAVHGLILVTRNEDDVAELGARVLNPFTFA